MSFRHYLLALAAATITSAAWAETNAMDKSHGQAAEQRTAAQRRADIDKVTQETMAMIYKNHPTARAQIAKAAGYAVFRTGGMTVLFLGVGAGEGAAMSKGNTTYMKMFEGKAGLGLGAQEMREVLVFTDQATFDKFVSSGWSADASASAIAKYGNKGGGIAGAKMVAKGVYAYQFADGGVVAEATVAGSKYTVDKDLSTQ